MVGIVFSDICQVNCPKMYFIEYQYFWKKKSIHQILGDQNFQLFNFNSTFEHVMISTNSRNEASFIINDNIKWLIEHILAWQVSQSWWWDFPEEKCCPKSHYDRNYCRTMPHWHWYHMPYGNKITFPFWKGDLVKWINPF